MRHPARNLSLAVAIVLLVTATASSSDLGNAQWIWSPKYSRANAPAGSLYFRKVVEVIDPAAAQLDIVCDDQYAVFLNGARVASGSDWRTIWSYDVGKHLHAGRNVIAVHAENAGQGPASLAARLSIRERSGKTFDVVTDSSWKFSEVAMPGWTQSGFDDSQWNRADASGPFGQMNPWGDQPKFAGQRTGIEDRFSPREGFRVEEVVNAGETGSLVAMAFNEDGNIIASREQGPLLLVSDKDRDGRFESVTTYCDKVQNCQGILPLDGDVFAVGHGPEGAGYYRLSDSNFDGRVKRVRTLLKFTYPMAEHGPHAAVLGRDGSIYLMVGNHARTQRPPHKHSPLHAWYDTDLLKPKYEDANGHAVGIKAPGGIVVRTDREGSFVEYFAGGFRNAYDMTFDCAGEMLTYDSDMEYDVGLPWYRPTRVNLVTQGSEAGWRSGWSKWPEYYLDSLPPVLNIGRGSPTGVEHYDHEAYPAKYHDATFMCDWSRGRVLAVMKSATTGEYSSEVFLEGRPLNCSDCAVGPDGSLYICVGGRGTQGSIFRVVYTGGKKSIQPPAIQDMHVAIQRAIAQPQIMSAWGRKAVQAYRQGAGDAWERELKAFIENMPASDSRRAKAIDLLELFGPAPKADFLIKLSRDPHYDVCRKAIYLIGVHGYPEGRARLIELLDDPTMDLARVACDALVRAKMNAPVEKLLPLLNSDDRFTRWAARRALEQLPVQEWKQAILGSRQPRVFTHGAIALLTVDPSRQTAEEIIKHCQDLMPPRRRALAELTDTVDLLRVMEVAIEQGKLEPQELPGLSSQLLALYPSQDWRSNRELATLLVFLQEPRAAASLVSQLGGDTPLVEKIHVAMRTPFLKRGWTSELRRQVLEFFEYARTQEGGNSFRGYLTNATNDFLRPLSREERLDLISRGAKMPAVSLGLVQGLPKQVTAREQQLLRRFDASLMEIEGSTAELQQALVAVLARGDDDSRAYVRGLFENAPQRRSAIVRVIADDVRRGVKRGDDWPLLVRSLAFVEGNTARDVLAALARMNNKSTAPQDFKHVILLGMRLSDQGGIDAVRLMEHWTGKKLRSTATSSDAVAAWKDWFVQTYPQLPPPVLPVEAAGSKWTYAQLLDFLASRAVSRGDVVRGAKIFEKARCVTCHKFGSRGEGIGPDLTNVSRRFQPKEILESVMFPSLVISDQFQSKMVLADGKSYVGIVGPMASGIIVHQSNGEKVEIKREDIEELAPSKVSAMPEGLFNSLNLQEIADLFAYLGKAPAGQ